MNNGTVLNNDIKTTRNILIAFCTILPLAPFLIAYLLITKNPTNTIDGFITSKRSRATANIAAVYFISIGTKELSVSNNIYKMLSVGDNVSAAYRKDTLYYYTKLN